MRQVLSASSLTPTVLGTVYQDVNSDSMPSAGEGISGVTVRLYADNGDGVFSIAGGDTQAGSDLVTDANGDYCFDSLDADTGYFVVIPSQSVGGTAFEEQVSMLTEPGMPGLLIDGFETTQSATASPPAPASATAVLTFANELEVIGRERDMVAELDTGDGEVRVIVNPFGSRPTLRYNADVAVTGSGTIVWDGVDVDASTISMGLDDRDLTNGGAETGIVFRIGAVLAGATARIRFYEGNTLNFSEASLAIPVSSGGAADSYEFIPFTDFSGPVQPTQVDAIEVVLDAGAAGANNIEFGLIGANGPKAVNFEANPTTDLAITKTDNQATAVPGESLTYTVTVTNNGPSDVNGATVTDALPAALTAATYSSTTTGTVSGNTANGSGSINDTVSMAAGSTIVYTITGTVAPSASGTITNTASVSPPSSFTDSNPNNNNAVDVDTLTPEVDLAITKTNNVATSAPGEAVNYVIVVTNNGPSDVLGATVTDLFPAELTNITYTSTTSGTVTGNTVSGSGDLNDAVDMAAGSTLTYNVSAILSASATGTISNTATVAAPTGVTETNLANNSATDTDGLMPESDLSISKTDNVTNVSPNDVLTYTIVVENAGPADVVGATVTDTFPSNLTSVTYTSSGSAGVSGNTASGAGNINETVNLPAGSTLTYTVTATVAANASGTIVNTATVSAPAGTTDPVTSNNSAVDTDTVTPEFDLSITKSDNRSTVVAGETTTYTIVVANSGPSDMSGVTVTDTFPAPLTGVAYSSVSSGGATGHTSAGTGNINDVVSLPAGATITYTATAQIPPSATGSITNTAFVAAPAGQTETNPNNNTASDTNTVERRADLSITKTNMQTSVQPGDAVTYQIVVSNAGPSDVSGASVTDAFPSELTSASYTSQASGGASGNTSGSGNISDVVTLPAGSSVTYTVSAMVALAAAGTLTNTAAVAAPAGVVDPNTTNNTATDSDTIRQILRSISGSVYVDLNNNGVFEANEPPIRDVSLSLSGTSVAGAPVSSATTTATDGSYEFANLSPGSYTVTQTQPIPFGDGRETIGQGSVTNVQATDNVFANIGLGAAEDAVGFNFGEARPNISKRDLLASAF